LTKDEDDTGKRLLVGLNSSHWEYLTGEERKAISAFLGVLVEDVKNRREAKDIRANMEFVSKNLRKFAVDGYARKEEENKRMQQEPTFRMFVQKRKRTGRKRKGEGSAFCLPTKVFLSFKYGVAIR
jgi:hypothetical protein